MGRCRALDESSQLDCRTSLHLPDYDCIGRPVPYSRRQRSRRRDIQSAAVSGDGSSAESASDDRVAVPKQRGSGDFIGGADNFRARLSEWCLGAMERNREAHDGGAHWLR